MPEYAALLSFQSAVMVLAGMIAGYGLSRRNVRFPIHRFSSRFRANSGQPQPRPAAGDDALTTELEIEIDELHNEVSRLKSLIQIQETEIELACQTINPANQNQLDSGPDIRHKSGPGNPADSVILSGWFATESLNSCYGGVIRNDACLGQVYSRPPQVSDDLQTISGITIELENGLNDHGIFTFEQIVSWNEPIIQKFAVLLEIRASDIVQNDWIGQARLLNTKRLERFRGAA